VLASLAAARSLVTLLTSASPSPASGWEHMLAWSSHDTLNSPPKAGQVLGVQHWG